MTKLSSNFFLGPLIKQESGKDIVYGVLAAGYKDCKELHTGFPYNRRMSKYVNIRDPWIIKHYLQDKVEDVVIEGTWEFRN